MGHNSLLWSRNMWTIIYAKVLLLFNAICNSNCCSLFHVLLLLAITKNLNFYRMTLRVKKFLYGFIPIQSEYQLLEMRHVREYTPCGWCCCYCYCLYWVRYVRVAAVQAQLQQEQEHTEHNSQFMSMSAQTQLFLIKNTQLWQHGNPCDSQQQQLLSAQAIQIIYMYIV